MNEHSAGSRQRRLRQVTIAAALAGTALLAACSGGPHPAGSGVARPDAVQQVDAFAQCMRSHGEPDFYITNQVPSTGSSSAMPVLKLGANEYVPGVNYSTPRYQAANKACQNLIPGLGAPPLLTAGQLHSLVQAAACMRAHGYPDWPDPTVRNGVLINVPPPAGIDISSPQFQAAQQTCHPAM